MEILNENSYVKLLSVVDVIAEYNAHLNRICPRRKTMHNAICLDLKSIISKLLPEDVRECKTGKWFVERIDSIYSMDIRRITCSVCGKSFNISADDLPDEDFCRRCGAYNKEKEYV